MVVTKLDVKSLRYLAQDLDLLQQNTRIVLTHQGRFQQDQNLQEDLIHNLINLATREGHCHLSEENLDQGHMIVGNQGLQIRGSHNLSEKVSLKGERGYLHHHPEGGLHLQ